MVSHTKVCARCNKRQPTSKFTLHRSSSGLMVEGRVCSKCYYSYKARNPRVPHKPNRRSLNAIHKLINAFLPTVISQLHKRGIHYGAAYFEDKSQDAYYALVKAANLYDPKAFKTGFYSFLIKYLNGALLNAMFKYNQVHFGEFKNWQKYHEKFKYLPLDKPISNLNEEPYPDLFPQISDDRTPLHEIYQKERNLEIRNKFNFLTDQEYAIALKLYSLPSRDRTDDDWNELARLCKPLCPTIKIQGYTKELDNFLYRFRYKLYKRRTYQKENQI